VVYFVHLSRTCCLACHATANFGVIPIPAGAEMDAHFIDIRQERAPRIVGQGFCQILWQRDLDFCSSYFTKPLKPPKRSEVNQDDVKEEDAVRYR
jgi:hypothetical protein